MMKPWHIFEEENGFSTALGVVIAFIILIVVGFAVFFFAWRPSEADFQAATNDIQTLKDSLTTASKDLAKAKSVTALDDNLVNDFANAAANYQQAVTNLSISPVTQHNSLVGATYDQHKAAIAAYGKSFANIAASFKAYRFTAKACGNMVNNFHTLASASDFDKLAADCSSGVSNGSASPDVAFNNQFFDKYRSRASAVVSTFRSLSKAGYSNSAAIEESLNAFNGIRDLHTIQIDYDTPASPLNGIEQLSSVVSSQKNQFLR